MKKLFSLFIIAFLLIGGCKMNEYNKVTNLIDLKNFEGKKVEVTGNISDVMWQHIANSPSSHPNQTYLDIGDYQTILYSKEPITEKGKLIVKGTVLAVQGGGPGQKSEDKFTEYHVVVDEYEKAP